MYQQLGDPADINQWNPIGLTPLRVFWLVPERGGQTNGIGRDVDNCSLGAKNAPKAAKITFFRKDPDFEISSGGGGRVQTYGIPLIVLISLISQQFSSMKRQATRGQVPGIIKSI